MLAIKARIKVVQGSTGAGKTHGIIPILINKAAKNPNLRITMVAETIPAVKDGCVRIFKNIMQDTNRWREDGWLGNPMEYKFANGTVIEFRAYDTVGKAKAADKRDILFINEANHVDFAIADTLITRSNREVWIDYNPDEEFWVDTEILTRPDAELITVTYLDNEACPEGTVQDLEIKMAKAFYNPLGDWNDKSNIKSYYWANWCRVYVRGERGVLEGVIFQNWKQIDEIPKEAKFVGIGMDFGYTSDPTTCMELWLWNNTPIWHEKIYEAGMKNGDIAKRLKSFGYGKWTFGVADSAEPKSIDEINEYGFKIKGSEKGADSIKYGIDLMQDQDFFVTSSSSNAIKELRKYAWEKDKNGNTTGQPIKFFNHCIDGMRYLAVEKLSKRKTPKSWGKSELR